MKKIIVSLLVMLLFTSMTTKVVYGSDKIDSTTWVEKAFKSAHDFLLEEPTVENNMSFLNKFLNFFKEIVKAVNYILLVLLGLLSIISLAITGVKYIMSSDNPNKLEGARAQLHQVFKGMLFGFGAFIIWNLSMGIIELILDAFA